MAQLNADMKDVTREIAGSFKQVKHDVEHTMESQVGHLVSFEKENFDLKKELGDLKQLCDSLNKNIEENTYKVQLLERDNMAISSKYNELRNQASATVSLAEDAQTYREEFNHIADLLLAASEVNNFPTFSFPAHFRTCAARNITSVLELTLQKYNNCILDYEKEIKSLKTQVQKKTADLEECLKDRANLSGNVSDLGREIETLDGIVKQKCFENNKLQDQLDNLKEEMFRIQHLNSDLNACVSRMT